MSRSKVFSCSFAVKTTLDAEKFILDKLEYQTAVAWYRAQIEGTPFQPWLRAVFGFTTPRIISTVSKMMGCECTVPTNVAATVKQCTNSEQRLNTTEPYSKGDIVTKEKVKGRKQEIDEIIREAEKCANYDEAMKYVASKQLRYFIEHRENISAYLKTVFPYYERVTRKLGDFNKPPISPAILKERTVILCGGSNLGKTAFALAHFNFPVIVTCEHDYEKITSLTDGLVIEMNFRDWDAIEVKHICDLNMNVGKFRRGLRRIICVLNETDFWPSEIIQPKPRNNDIIVPGREKDFLAISKRVFFFNVTGPLLNGVSITNILNDFNCGNSSVHKIHNRNRE
jgi:hypothetical protein